MANSSRAALPTMKMAMAMTSLCVSALLIACVSGILPDYQTMLLQSRASFCETVAIQVTLDAQRKDFEGIRSLFESVAQRQNDVRSLAVRDPAGNLLVEIGPHEAHWQANTEGTASVNHVFVPISLDGEPWGNVEATFEPPTGGLILGFLPRNSPTTILIFVGTICFVAFWIYLRTMFRQSSGGEAVPQRVRSAMNTLAEGVLILDKDQRIALANDAFGLLAGLKPEDIQGKTVTDLPWFPANEHQSALPWDAANDETTAQTGLLLGLKTPNTPPQTLSVNTAPIVGDDGNFRGSIATFDNLTNIERKNAQLRKVLLRLRHSRSVVRRQNDELKDLATRDPLTGCFNRRTLFAELDKLWKSSKRYAHPLSVVMVDVDHFKSVNDRYGHGVGDDVLKQVAEVLRTTARKTDVVCRYGGEEFCVLLPHIDVEEAKLAAERFRLALAATKCGPVSVTASIGVASVSLGAESMQLMIDQADKALYAAKRSGRNRVYRFDHVPADLLMEKNQPSKPAAANDANTPSEIPFHAVAALVSALAYRDQDTAEHSRRVADLCVMLSGDLMSQKECYVVEVAGLLHDIGKLGVPDAVLFKPNPLTAEELNVIRAHEAIGLDILRAAFTSHELTEILRTYHFWYDGGSGSHSDMHLVGDKLPLGARILAIADAYDSITSDRVYRKGATSEKACEELRRCAGTQFDAVLVERFINRLRSREKTRQQTSLPMSKRTALQIGLQIERLAQAADGQDTVMIAQMAGHLKDTAKEHGITPIAEVAAQLEKTATGAVKPNKLNLVKLTIDLLDMCRSTQRSLLPPINRNPGRVRSERKA